MIDGIDPWFETFVDKDQEKLENWFGIKKEGILKDFEDKNIKTFVFDLFLVFDIFDSIAGQYSTENNNNIENLEKRFNVMINDWNKKYREMLLKFEVKSYEYTLIIYLKEADLSELKSIVQKMNRCKHVELNENVLEASFLDLDDKSENTLTIRKENSRLKLIYNQEDMLDLFSPEFRICTFYALQGGFEDINLQKYADEFSFISSKNLKSGGSIGSTNILE